ncbi:MAG: GH92 family glycosyl hydrolase [Paludibacter sp.]|jgi:predicted alpha-1,2-mannosidase|nr:GH92 family glycosyl hydrolase [Paludibacter sp.]
MKFRNFSLFSVLVFLLLCSFNVESNTKLNKFVDPYIGTGGHGHSFLGVTTPFGAVQIGPNNFNKGWDWCSGYHHSDSVLIGFSHLHLNGTGCTEGGDLLFMPYTGELQTQPGSQNNPSDGYASYYSHDNEEVSSAYYSLLLEDYQVKAEFTATDRVAFHRYTFPKGEENKQVMINLKDDSGGTTTDSYMEQVDDYTIQGFRFSRAWSPSQQIYFTAVFSEPIKLILYDDNTQVEGKKFQSRAVKGNVCFDSGVSKVSVKVGISPVSMGNALANINAELDHWNFKKIVKQTEKKWGNELARVEISTKDESVKRIFYTAMYHAFMQPIAFNDVNGDYRGSDKKVYPNASFNNYTVFSLWDTYRAAHPLYTILQPERVPDFINSMLAIKDEQGLLPVWHLYGADTKEMIGIQSVPVIADAILKEFKGFDYERAYQAMKSSMLSNYKGLNHVKNNKYIPSDKEIESVAKGLEYAIADWGIAQVAKKLGHEADYELFSERANYYKLYWDKNTHFFRGVKEDGSFSTPFEPSKSSHRQDDYCEGTGWQYTWLVPQDVEGLISLFGSEKAFTTKLDSLFMLDKTLMGDKVSPDISGLIGQYAHGNEPGHHTVYLYAFGGEQWKTAEKVREILKTMYFDNPNGIAGNEDCGQMSSWYIFSSLGFYPVNPSNGIYVFGSPIFDEATISLPDNKEFEIITKNNSDENIYIQSVQLNGEDYPYSYIKHNDIMKGGKLIFTMGNTPNKEFGSKMEFRPKSIN